MRNLFWKIFFSFWLSSILIIAISAWLGIKISDSIATSPFIDTIWVNFSVRCIITLFISGLICYLLSIYLTQPLNQLRTAVKSLAKGQFNTRIGQFIGHHQDELAELREEFNNMAEQLEILIHSKERLLQDISHELRSPLARLNLAIELGRKKSNHLAEIEFNRMQIECLRLNTLIRELLDFARLDKSTDSLSKSLVDLPELIHQIIKDSEFEFSKQNQQIRSNLPNSLPIYIDKRLIHRSIENILRNALQYSLPQQEVIITLYSKKQNRVILDIEDNGPGIPENQLTKIFNPFYRVDDARENKTGGYGLGLAIAKQAIQLHGGKITAKNRKFGGLLIQIELKLEKKNE